MSSSEEEKDNRIKDLMNENRRLREENERLLSLSTSEIERLRNEKVRMASMYVFFLFSLSYETYSKHSYFLSHMTLTQNIQQCGERAGISDEQSST